MFKFSSSRCCASLSRPTMCRTHGKPATAFALFGFFSSLFDRLRLIWVVQFGRLFSAALFPFHLCQLPHNLPLIGGDALLDGLVHLQGLLQREQMIRAPMPA